MDDMMLWEEVEDEVEKFSDTDINDAESMGRLPIGKFLCTCIKSDPREMKLSAYTCIAANLQFSIDKVFEINGSVVNPAEFEHLEKRYIWDSIFLPHPDEKAGMKKRRVLIARRFGLIGPGQDNDISNKTWSKDVLNKQVIITTEKNSWQDKDTGALKTNTKVAFSGYEAVANQPVTVNADTTANANTTATANPFPDI